MHNCISFEKLKYVLIVLLTVNKIKHAIIMDNKNESINPFTGMPNSKCMQLQNSWENILAGEYGVNPVLNPNDLDMKFKKAYLNHPMGNINEFNISYEQMCPSAIPFMFDVKI